MRDGIEFLLDMGTIWSPVHDLISGNEAHARDALAYLAGRFDSPFPPPEYLVEVFSNISDKDLRKIKSARNNKEAYEYIAWLWRKRRSRTSEPAPQIKQSERRREHRGRKLSLSEINERLRLAPTMTSWEFARHFGLKKPGSACKWCLEHGVRLKGCR